MSTRAAFSDGLDAAMNYDPKDWANIVCPYVARENQAAWFAGLRAGQEILAEMREAMFAHAEGFGHKIAKPEVV